MKHLRLSSKCFSKYVASIIASTIIVVMPIANAEVIDGASIEVGAGKHSMMYKLAVQKTMTDLWPFLVKHSLHPYLEMDIAELRNQQYKNIHGQSQSIISIGFTPVLRWQPIMEHGFGVEIGIGANYFSQIYDNAGEKMATKFQFGDHIALVYKFSKSFEIIAKFQHYSNAGIKRPNPAVNFGSIKLGYLF